MEIDKLFENNSIDSVADNVFGVVNNSVSEVREMQRKKVAENVQLVVNALKKIEQDIKDQYDSVSNNLEKRIISIKDGRDGIDGRDGKDGKDGKQGKDGRPGRDGKDGKNGLNGESGEDGVSVVNAHIDFDGSLIISLSSGKEINVGEVVAPALAEQIKVITNGGGTSQSVLDTLTSLQSQIDALSGATIYKGLWNASTNSPALTSSVGTSGNFYIVSVAGSTSLDGITNWGVGDWAIFNGSVWQRVEGGAAGNFTTVTASSLTSGRVTYAGTAGLLQDSSNLTFNGTTLTSAGFSGPLNGTVGATTPAAGAFTTLSATGNVTLGDASTDTVTVNGYMGVGGAGNTGVGVYVRNTALTTTSQVGFQSQITATSAATGGVYGLYVANSTEAASFTVGNAYGVRLSNLSLGAGSSATNQHGLHIADLTSATNNYGITSLVSSGANKWNIYASGTAANYFAGNVQFAAGTAAAPALTRFGDENTGIFFPAADVTAITTAGSERMRIDSSGNVGIGTSSLAGYSLRILKSSTGATTTFGVSNEATIQSDVTGAYYGYFSGPSTAAAAFTLGAIRHFEAYQSTIGATSAVTNQYGFLASATLTGATNNYGFFSQIASGSNRWNFYANGTADNYMAGSLGVGALPASDRRLNVAFNGSSTAALEYGMYVSMQDSAASGASAKIAIFGQAFTTGAFAATGALVGLYGSIAHNLTNTLPDARGVFANISNNSTGTITNAYDLFAGNATNAGTITNLYGLFVADLTVGTNNYGIRSGVTSGANKWNLYIDGTAQNYFAGNVGIGTSSPGAKLHVSVTDASSALKIERTGAGATSYTADFNGAVFNQSISAGADFVWIEGGAEWMRLTNTGNVGIGTSSPTAKLDVSSDVIRLRTAKTPASASATGNAGDIAWDSSYIYVCVATNTWKRVAIATW